MSTSRIAALSCGAVLLAWLGAHAADVAPSYTVTKSVPPRGRPNTGIMWSSTRRRAGVYSGARRHRSRWSTAATGHVVGKVEGIAGGTHGIGVSPATGKGYTDDGKAGQAVAFDLKTLKLGAHIPAADDADAIAFDPVTGHIFVVEGDPASVTVIDPKTDKAVATIAGGGKLEYAVADDKGHLYANGAGKRDVVSVNTRTNAVEAHWAIPDCANPHGLAIDKVRRRLFVTCVNSLMTVVNADTGAVVAAVPIGKGTRCGGL